MDVGYAQTTARSRLVVHQSLIYPGWIDNKI